MDYTPELGRRICAHMVEGKSLRSICKMDGMPSKSGVMLWLQQHDEFLKIYCIAQQERAEAYAEEVIDIADDGSNDYVLDEEGVPRFDHEHVQRSKLRVEARKWICAKMKPKKYGDKVELDGSVELKHRLIING